MYPVYPSFKREVASVVLKVTAVVTTVIILFVVTAATFSSFEMVSDGTCNIAVYPIQGVIAPYTGVSEFGDLVTGPDELRSFISAAEDDTAILGIMFEVNSPGGYPVASERMMEEVAGLSLPNTVLVGDGAASGGYMIASAADHIIASAMSDVGSIGATMSYVDQVQQNEEDGLHFNQLSTGKFKDAGNPDKPLTEEERALFESQLHILHEHFIDLVSENRNLERDTVAKIADGSTLIGLQAVEAGLVDEIGGRRTAKKYFATTLGLTEDKISFCEYSSLLPF